MIKIVKMSVLDVPQIAELEQECFSSPWSESSLLYAVNDPNSAYFAAKDGEKTVGYGGINFVLDEGFIGNVAVKSDYRRKGVGLSIIESIISLAEEKKVSFISLEVRKSNTPAILLYEKCGFLDVGIRKDFYIWPTEDAVIMTQWFNEKKV